MTDGEDRMFELKVGIFIAAGIIIFFIIVFSIGDVYLIKKGYHVNVLFNFANGLRESAPVRLAGVNVGQVEKIDLFFDETEGRTKVKIFAWIQDEKIKIKKDSTAAINTLGLLGEKYLEIFPSQEKTNFFLANGEEIIGHDPVPTAVLTEKVESLAESVSVIMKRLEDGEGTIGKLLTDDTVYYNLESFTEDIKKNPWKLLHKPREGK